MAGANKKLHTDFDTLHQFVMSVNSIDTGRILKVTKEEQEKEISSLKETTGDERFFFVVNMDSFSIEYSCAVKKWLGYSEDQFSLKMYWDRVVHPESKKSLLLVSQQMYKLLCTGHFPLQFMTQRFAGRIVLKHYKGHFLLDKKPSAIFQYDANNRLVKYIDEFTLLGEYDETNVLENTFGTRIFNTNGESEREKRVEIVTNMVKQFSEMKIFSVTELQTARKIAYTPGITKKELAIHFSLAPATIQTLCNRFLEKARNFFQKDFPTVLAAALYLKQEGLL